MKPRALGFFAAFGVMALMAPGLAQDAGEGEGEGTSAIQPPIEMPAEGPRAGEVDRPHDPGKGPVTNLPLPRYVSLKGSEGNARRGPSLSHRIDWVFRHPGMPLRVTAEFGHWRRVEDRDGAGGWVHYALLSGVRTAIVQDDMAQLLSRPDPNASVVARAETGAILRLNECIRDWCRLTGGGARGWLPKSQFWGADPEETRE